MKTYIAYLLRKTAFFGGLTPEACARLSEVCAHRGLRKRETLFAEGEPGGSIYLLEKGAVQLFKSGADGSEVVIRTVKPGDVFAEVILFETREYPVTAVALSASRVIGFRREDILHLLDDRAFRNEFIAMLMRKQRYLASRIHYLVAFSAEERLFRFLREQYGEIAAITPGLSKKDMASAIGTTPETFSRLIGQLTRKGLVKWRGKTIEVKPVVWKRLADEA